MRNIKLLIRKYGFLSLILLIVVIVGGVFGRKFYTEDKKVEEEIWKPSVTGYIYYFNILIYLTD
mgnify:CR=1 FL=1